MGKGQWKGVEKYSGSGNWQEPAVVWMREMGETEESRRLPRFLGCGTGEADPRLE